MCCNLNYRNAFKELLRRKIRPLIALLTSVVVLANSLLIPASISATGQFGNPNASMNPAHDRALKPADQVALAARLSEIPSEQKHPNAGVYPIWAWWITPEEFSEKYPYLEGQQIFITWSELKPAENEPYQWNVLDARIEARIGDLEDKVLYLQLNAVWPDWIFNHVAQASFTERGNHPPQFWDPIYINLYRQFINDVAQHVAQSDYKDKILLVRAQYNALNPEAITPWNHFSYTDFEPTSAGHIYKVDFTREIGNEYARQIVKTYLDAFKPLGIQVVTKPFGATQNDFSLAEEFANMGAGFFSTNSTPNPIARNETLRLSKHEARVRSFSEPYNTVTIRDNPLQWLYWQTLSDLHQGVEFISYYGDDLDNETYAEIFEFAQKYAGWYRQPEQSPGAWIAFRDIKNSSASAWGGGYLEGNYEYLISQLEPNNSLSLFAYNGTGEMDEFNLNPQSKPITNLGTQSQKEGIWARQTNGQPIYLDINDTFAASLGGDIALKISYFDGDNGKFQLSYNDQTGQLKTHTFAKTGTQLWKEATLTINSYQFSNNLEKNADIQLLNAGDGEDIFHLVEIVRLDSAPPLPTQPPLPTPTDEPTSEPTVEPTSEPTAEPTPAPLSLTLNGPASVGLNETFNMGVEVLDVTGEGLYGVQFELNYDPSLISISNLQINPDLPLVVLNGADDISGKIRFVASRQGNVSGLTGNITLLTFEATALGVPGVATFSFGNELMSDRQARGIDLVTQTQTVSIGDTGTPVPTVEPTSEPTTEPTPLPTDEPTPVPTDEPTPVPTDEPTPVPTDEPTPVPTDEPTPVPTDEPTPVPTSEPTIEPTPIPTDEPTPVPTGEPIATLLGQIILAGRANNDWSNATLTIQDGQYGATTDPTGHFTIANVIPGPYNNLIADASGYLPAVCNTFSITPPETTLAAVILLSGDINDDALVDIGDAAAIGVSFGTTGPGLPADINQDQTVNIFDIVLVAINFGQGTQTWSCQAPNSSES